MPPFATKLALDPEDRQCDPSSRDRSATSACALAKGRPLPLQAASKISVKEKPAAQPRVTEGGEYKNRACMYHTLAA
jgi:hypothetical protein